jgi:hypothetical protein
MYGVDVRIEVREDEVPADLLEFAKEKRQVLIGTLADIDDVIADKFLMEEEPSIDELMVLNTLFFYHFVLTVRVPSVGQQSI